MYNSNKITNPGEKLFDFLGCFYYDYINDNVNDNVIAGKTILYSEGRSRTALKAAEVWETGYGETEQAEWRMRWCDNGSSI